MIDNEKRRLKELNKEKIRSRMNTKVDEDNYEYFPEKQRFDFHDTSIHQRVAIYVRVSTEDEMQTTSFELQKRYYNQYIQERPNWTLVKIYADEGISGTVKNRPEFQKMMDDCIAGKIDVVITKSVSRFARDVLVTVGYTRTLAELNPPVGVFFETESIFSLKDESQMALTFLATVAEEESHIRSRSMETSLRMRLDNGIPLTPKLLGYTHDEEGQLIINPAEAPTVKLAFYMYLYGYSAKQIAETLNALGRRSYLGNIKWTSGGVVQILRNERHCGEVLTRKTFTPNYREHKSKKNRGERPQSRYFNHHEAIVSREDFIAVQKMLDNAKYRNRSFLPELKVIKSGILQGFVIIYPRWAAFKEDDYMKASAGGYSPEENPLFKEEEEINIEMSTGDFDLRGFEVARTELFDNYGKPFISFSDKAIKLSSLCVKKLAEKNCIELLVNPITRKFAIRTAETTNRQSVICSKKNNKKYEPKVIPITAFYETLYSLFGWNTDYNYRIIGTLYEKGNDIAYIFDTENTEAFLKPYLIPSYSEEVTGGFITYKPLTPYGKRIKAIPEEWVNNFGKDYYLHEKTYEELNSQSEKDWKLRMEGQFIDTGKKINVTGFDTLKAYISQELQGLNLKEESNDESI